MSNNPNISDDTLTDVSHQDADKHWVGESLPAPSSSDIASVTGSTSSPGASPFPARADHTHKLDPGIFPFHSTYFPSGNVDATTSSSYVTWIAFGSFTVPTWARSAIIQINISGVYAISAGAAYAFEAGVTMGATSGDAGIFDMTTINLRTSVSFSLRVGGFAVGTQWVEVNARRWSGTGQLRADSASKFEAITWFSPNP